MKVEEREENGRKVYRKVADVDFYLICSCIALIGVIVIKIILGV